MKCQQYVFLVSSGQLTRASTTQKGLAKAHYLMCPNCRNFTKNDALLTRVVQAHKQKMLDEVETALNQDAS